jgi:tRNA-specific 2-thiouridylase
MKQKRVVVAMSGGVDSSVAAALLKKQGYDVVGLTMCFNLPDSATKKPRCCDIEAIEDARRVAHTLGIRHYVINMKKALEEYVIRDFCAEYLKGRTPNPCVRCNQFIKFDLLLKRAIALDAQFLATGHYARVLKVTGPPCLPAGRHVTSFMLKKAKDKKKDQSYFLYRLKQSQLKHVIFPLGNYTKEEVRSLGRKFNLAVAEKPASQEICFLPTADYRGFIKAQINVEMQPGLIVDAQGNVLGRHKGIALYTTGQRAGLGIAKGYPLYITKIDPKNNRITVGKKEEACAQEFLVRDPHFINAPIKKKVAMKVRIRYNHKEAPACLFPFGHKIRVRFERPQFAITPGQSAVFYDKDTVLGGGVIA